MLAARYLAPNRVEAVEIDLPAPGPGEALIEVEVCGICGSDLAIVAGSHPRAKAPLTIGHEFCGRVVAMGGNDGGRIREGDRVTLYPLISCGACYVCRNGAPHVCRTLRLYGIDAEGGMAGFVKAPLSSLVRLPDEMSGKTGALIEPLAVGIHAVSRTGVAPQDTAVVLGAGPIGLITAMALRLRGVERIFVSEPEPFRLRMAEHFGFTPLDAGSGETLERVREATAGEGADVLFECTGHPRAALEMTDMVRPRGVIVNVGVFKKPVEVNMQAVNFKEISIIGSRVYSMDDFAEAAWQAGNLPLEHLVTHEFPLERVGEAFALFRSGENVCKVLLRPPAPAV
jgi:(R,R)-butanediol dehydrogenase / meso-butanediol dehydrogenase / diacetyl reductase